jgi:hypothetical protein
MGAAVPKNEMRTWTRNVKIGKGGQKEKYIT